MTLSLGLNKPVSETKVVVAMSGGVDSSVTAALLAEAGYEVIGITLQLYDHGLALMKKGACCAGQDIYDARRVADKLGFAHYVLDYESRFKESVIDDFADTYLRGATPIPCVRCNQKVKFHDLLKTAQELGADCMATGHYVRRVETPHGAELHRAAEQARDQSYFLFATTQSQLDYVRFPIGDMPKPDVRSHAERLGLEIAQKPDSQDICFVPNGDYAKVVARVRPEAIAPGDIIDTDGQTLGQHDGIIHYTVGQRRGLPGGGTEPRYVVGLDAPTQRVIIGPKAALARNHVTLNDCNWLVDFPGTELECLVKLRSLAPAVPCTVTRTETGATIHLHEAQFGVSPGQAAVFYHGSRVLGGGWIQNTAKI